MYRTFLFACKWQHYRDRPIRDTTFTYPGEPFWNALLRASFDALAARHLIQLYEYIT